MEKNQWTVGVDLGGTSIKMAFINDEGRIIDKWEIPTDLSEKGRFITRDIAKSIEEKLEQKGETKDKLVGLGMGAPGFINFENGSIFEAVNIGWKNYPLQEKMEEAIGLPVAVDNDANLAALGEMWKGAGEGAKDLLCITLGTGVGGGVISNGAIIHGIGGMAGEIGHITSITDGGYTCNCGRKGCLETVASATGIRRLAIEGLEKHTESELYTVFQKQQDLTTKDVFDAARNQDAYALSIVDHVTYHLGLALSNVAILLNFQKLVIGGGVSMAGETLLEPLDRHIKALTLPGVYQGLEIVRATLGNDAGVIGCAWLINKKLNRL
ncbi:glucokinase [Pullulanibacillus pueri]|uniref:Glucokinase n=1 Tax=Pullulanibacillus pueri TaxID=1437324 RepID=A0A8J2ZUL3_9BACL|nr:ROK family glucokinase [Pullulanibacillus pueri]MBM7681542.1 glucokinase [Pullulanibacillus pueri]GGH79742.1 glucokinase [Pullulanibacillus pueri]